MQKDIDGHRELLHKIPSWRQITGVNLMSKLRYTSNLILFLLFGIVVIKACAVAASVIKAQMQDIFVIYMVIAASNLLAATLVGILNCVFAKFLSREQLGDIGLDLSSSSIRIFFSGLVLTGGIAVLVGMISILLFDISYQLELPITKAVGLVIIASVSTLFQCAAEELWMRSWFLTNFARLAGNNLAVMATGAAFGLLHLLNSNYSWLGVLNATFAGIMFSSAFIKARSVWLPIGLHFGWNMVLGLLLNNQIFRLSSPSLEKISIFSAAEGTWWGVAAILCAMFFVISKQSYKLFGNCKHEETFHSSHG